MATTEIHAIRSTPERAVRYCMSDKIVPIKSEDEVHKDCPYQILDMNGQLYALYKTQNSFYMCNSQNPMSTFNKLRHKFQHKLRSEDGRSKGGEPLLWHMHLSFSGREASVETADEIGRKFAEKVFGKFPCVISTHTNSDNIHCHFMVSAWDITGHKWHNCHATTRLIRETADKLCEEYGLSVLKDTKDMNLVKYKDKEGNVHYYEPTDRKNEMIQMRDDGVNYSDDVNSHRNTESYNKEEERKLTNREIVKRDIDNLLPSCASYDELLMRLRLMGYVIRDKKKNGEWLAHISFKNPTADKGTREDKIGDGEFYVRENLTAYIESQLMREMSEIIERDEDNDENRNEVDSDSIPYFEDYEYGETDISSINDDYRKCVNQDGLFHVVKRSNFERKVISSIKQDDATLKSLADAVRLQQMIAEQRNQQKQHRPYRTDTEELRLVARINQSFRCLQYTEKSNIHSYNQMLDMYKANLDSYADIIRQRDEARNAIETMKRISRIPQMAAALDERIRSNKNDVVYVMEHLTADKKQLEQYQTLMRKYNIESPHEQELFRKKVDGYDGRLSKCEAMIQNARTQMDEIENCIRTYSRIDSEHGIDTTEVIRRFNEIRGENPTGNDGSRKRNERQGHV